MEDLYVKTTHEFTTRGVFLDHYERFESYMPAPGQHDTTNYTHFELYYDQYWLLAQPKT